MLSFLWYFSTITVFLGEEKKDLRQTNRGWPLCQWSSSRWISWLDDRYPVRISESPSLFEFSLRFRDVRASVVPRMVSIAYSLSFMLWRFQLAVQRLKRAGTSHQPCANDKPAQALLFTRLMRCRQLSSDHGNISKCIRGWDSHPSTLPPPPACACLRIIYITHKQEVELVFITSRLHAEKASDCIRGPRVQRL